jgi:diguanylate cyclase (GGDEF)-like protein
MKRTMRQWVRNAVSLPGGDRKRPAIIARAVVALAGILFIAEAAVSLRFSGNVGVLMMASTAGLGAFVFRGIQVSLPNAELERADEHPLIDGDTGLPTRQLLIDHLSRDISRSERYSHSLTLAVVRISQYEETKSSWGPATGRLAVEHVADTLRRITRASDFLCRLDESTFAVILLQCSGRQANIFGDRLSLAVSNRPLKAASRVKVPLYVGVEVNALEYDSARFRGPLEFISLAGGEVPTPRPARQPVGIATASTPRKASLAADPRSLRRQLVKDYYPAGEMKDFAEAYKEARNRNRHAG